MNTNQAVNPERWEQVEQEIREACDRADRTRDEINLIAVTKGFDDDLITKARDFGFTDVGENRAGEFLDKKQTVSLSKDIQWHFIGQLQSNKVRKIIGEVDLIHTVDRHSLIDELEKRYSREGLSQDVLMQVNVSGEESKSGVSPDEAPEILEAILDTDQIDVHGLMTIAPWTDERSVLESTFSDCRQLRNRLEEEFDVELPELSMGMTNDYKIAIQHGATSLRLGRALFGERPD